MNIYRLYKRIGQDTNIEYKDVRGYTRLRQLCNNMPLHKSTSLSIFLKHTVYHGYGETNRGCKFEYFAELIGKEK